MKLYPIMFRLVLVYLSVAILTGACSSSPSEDVEPAASEVQEELELSVPEEDEGEVPTEAPTEVPTVAPEPTEETTENETSNDETENSEQPSENLIGNEGQPLDSCLVGKWSVVPESMGEYLTNAMNPDEQDLFVVEQVSGDFNLYFTDTGEMSVDSEEFLIKVVLDAENLNVEMNLLLEAEGTAVYQADGFSISNWNRDYESTGFPIDSVLTAVSEGEAVYQINVTPDWFTAGITEVDGEEEAIANYNCSEDSLTMQPNISSPVVFKQAN